MSAGELHFDVEVRVVPYPRVHVHAAPGRRARTDNPDALVRLQEFYKEFRYLLPSKVRNAELDCPVAVRLVIFRRAERTGDIDNLAKSILDGLVRARVLTDDKWVSDLAVRAIQGPRVARSRVIGHIAPLQWETWLAETLRVKDLAVSD